MHDHKFRFGFLSKVLKNENTHFSVPGIHGFSSLDLCSINKPASKEIKVCILLLLLLLGKQRAGEGGFFKGLDILVH